MIVDMHGGKISVQNRTDGQTGSRFTVELPKQSAVANAEQTATPAPVVKPVSKGEVGNILVVDDDTDLSAYVARELSPHFRCQTAKNGNVYDHIVMKWSCVADDVRNGKAGKLPNDKLVTGSSAPAKTSGESMDGFLSIPDGMDEELPF
jgi:hypothetical protein